MITIGVGLCPPVGATVVSGCVIGGSAVGAGCATGGGGSAGCVTGVIVFAALLLVDNKVRFVAGPVRNVATELEFSNRTPMGFAALKTKPRAVPRARMAANCHAILRVIGTRAAADAELVEAVGGPACAGAGVELACGLRFLRPLPMRAEISSPPPKSNGCKVGELSEVRTPPGSALELGQDFVP